MTEVQEGEIVHPSERRISAVWVLPVLAVALGAWMLYFNWSNRGPVITIEFETAEGVDAGKTKIKARNVSLGTVESVVLSDDLESVRVTAQLDPSARHLVREDTQFWVVRARVDAGGVSGLGTLLSGGYIELAPGKSDIVRTRFVGLESPPVTPVGTPGQHVVLFSEKAGSLGTGDPVLHHGYPVGQIEAAAFDVELDQMRYDAFIKAPFDENLSTTSRFWLVSGVNMALDAQGFSVQTGSLQTIVTGGVAFASLDVFANERPVEADALFRLYASEAAAREHSFVNNLSYVVLFEQSVRGLSAGAPVEFMGIQIGYVDRIMLREAAAYGVPGVNSAIPVLLHLEPGRLFWQDNLDGLDRLRTEMEKLVAQGLHATLQTGNLLSGQLLVSLELDASESAGEIGSYLALPTLPARSSGLALIEDKIVAILDKVKEMPLDELGETTQASMEEMRGVLKNANESLESLSSVLASDAAQEMPAELNETLASLRDVLATFGNGTNFNQRVDTTMLELQSTLNSLDRLLRSLEEKPNSLIFPVEHGPDPVPGERIGRQP